MLLLLGIPPKLICFSFSVYYHFQIRIRYYNYCIQSWITEWHISDSTDRLNPFSWQCPWGVVARARTGSLTSRKHQCFLIEEYDLMMSSSLSTVNVRFCLFEALQRTAIVSLAPSATTLRWAFVKPSGGSFICGSVSRANILWHTALNCKHRLKLKAFEAGASVKLRNRSSSLNL